MRSALARVVSALGLAGCVPHVVAPPSPTPVAATDEAARTAYARALLAAQRGDGDTAARELAWVSRLDDSVWANLAVGRLRLEQGDVSGAAVSVEAAASARPGDATTLRALGDLRAAQGEVEQARFLWIEAARAGDEDAWSLALDGATGATAEEIMAAWSLASIPSRLRAVRAAAEAALRYDERATIDWAAAMDWTATPDILGEWASVYVRGGCLGSDPTAWMASHDPGALGPAWTVPWSDACVTLGPCEPFDETRQCLDRALEVTPPGPLRTRLVAARDRLDSQRR